MATHEAKVYKTADHNAVFGRCSCRTTQTKPVPTRQEAEDWIRWHLDQVKLAQADPGNQLPPAKYLAYLRERAADEDLPQDQRDQWAVLADEQERRVRLNVQPKMKGVPVSPNAKYDTGVETEPMW